VGVGPTAKLAFKDTIQRKRKSLTGFIGGVVVHLRSASRKKFVHAPRLSSDKHFVCWKLAKRRQDHALIYAVNVGLKYAGELIGYVHSSGIAFASLHGQYSSIYAISSSRGIVWCNEMTEHS